MKNAILDSSVGNDNDWREMYREHLAKNGIAGVHQSKRLEAEGEVR